MVDYEKGSPAWDIGMILTRHDIARVNGKTRSCERVQNLQDTVGAPAAYRLEHALGVACTCGVGDPSEERTSLRPKIAAS